MYSSLTHPKKDLDKMDPLWILDPFLQVIQCGDTTGPITGSALLAVEKFIQRGIIGTIFF